MVRHIVLVDELEHFSNGQAFQLSGLAALRLKSPDQKTVAPIEDKTLTTNRLVAESWIGNVLRLRSPISVCLRHLNTQGIESLINYPAACLREPPIGIVGSTKRDLFVSRIHSDGLEIGVLEDLI